MGDFYVLRKRVDLQAGRGPVGPPGIGYDAAKPAWLLAEGARTDASVVEARLEVGSFLEQGRTAVAQQRRKVMSRQIEAQIRRIFLLVDEFRSLCLSAFEPHRRIAVVDAIIHSGRGCFTLAAQVRAATSRSANSQLSPQEERCLRDLELLLLDLRADDPPAKLELDHAMDAIIMQCAALDARVDAGPPVAGSYLDDGRA